MKVHDHRSTLVPVSTQTVRIYHSELSPPVLFTHNCLIVQAGEKGGSSRSEYKFDMKSINPFVDQVYKSYD